GGVAAHYISNAADNVKADPTLCNAIGKQMAELSDLVSNLKSKLKHGDIGSIAGIASSVTSMTALAKSQGANITETYNQ
ncbi:MAG TPA: hypothetical protein VN088_00090, partial [Nocardioides sp.]|nr:hypothetical protein [Nocardioides sp.]